MLYQCANKFVKVRKGLHHSNHSTLSTQTESIHRCSFFLDIFDIEWPDEMDCDKLPDSNDPDICVGNRRSMELNQLANRHSKLLCMNKPLYSQIRQVQLQSLCILCFSSPV